MKEETVADFRGSLRGRLIVPTDPDYDEARALYNGMIDKRPSLIARCVDVAALPEVAEVAFIPFLGLLVGREMVSRIGVPANNLFPVGETLITYIATDVNGNTASVTQTVTVVDNTPPIISRAEASPSILWPPNHGMVDVTIDYEAADNCAVLESWLSVSSSVPGSGSDSEVVDAHHVRLRAARSGRWGERLYTVTITTKDIHGNLSTQNVTIRVPQSKGEGRM